MADVKEPVVLAVVFLERVFGTGTQQVSVPIPVGIRIPAPVFAVRDTDLHPVSDFLSELPEQRLTVDRIDIILVFLGHIELRGSEREYVLHLIPFPAAAPTLARLVDAVKREFESLR
jgi:hypothetical protein